jgi:hypothetical protein
MSDREDLNVEDRTTTATFRIHPLQTDRVQIKSAQLRRRRGGPARVSASRPKIVLRTRQGVSYKGF